MRVRSARRPRCFEVAEHVRPRRTAWVTAVGAPVAFVILIAVQALLAVRIEDPLDNPEYVVDATVGPQGDEPPLRLAVLGDSTVAGLGAPTMEEALPVQVAERVASALDRRVAVMGYGVSGARTADLHEGQLPDVGGFAPDVVVIVIGSNDATHLTPTWTMRAELDALLVAVAEELGAPVVLGGVPLFGEATALARPLRDVVGLYAAILRPVQRSVADEHGATFVDIARDASPRFVGVADAMSRDGFHPAPTGYGFWADAIAPAVIDALEPTRR
jgi:lysophospholipase L1-like esterase